MMQGLSRSYPEEASRKLEHLAEVFNQTPYPTWQSISPNGERKLYAKFGADVLQWTEERRTWVAIKPEMAAIVDSVDYSNSTAEIEHKENATKIPEQYNLAPDIDLGVKPNNNSWFRKVDKQKKQTITNTKQKLRDEKGRFMVQENPTPKLDSSSRFQKFKRWFFSLFLRAK